MAVRRPMPPMKGMGIRKPERRKAGDRFEKNAGEAERQIAQRQAGER